MHKLLKLYDKIDSFTTAFDKNKSVIKKFT